MSDRIECTGQFLSDKKCGVKVELEMYGIANDSVRRKHQTKTINNSICPRWDNEEPFVFAKVMYLQLNGNSAAVIFEFYGKTIRLQTARKISCQFFQGIDNECVILRS